MNVKRSKFTAFLVIRGTDGEMPDKDDETGISGLRESTLIMVDDNIDEIFLTRRQVRRDGIVNRFVSEKKPEHLLETLDELIELGVNKESFLVLLDISMPRFDGFEMLKKIRGHPVYKDVTVLMLSASDDETDRYESRKLGCDGYIVKPFSAGRFFDAVQDIPGIKNQIMQ